MRKKRFEDRLLTVQPDITKNESWRNVALLLEWTIIPAHAEHVAESAGLVSLKQTVPCSLPRQLFLCLVCLLLDTERVCFLSAPCGGQAGCCFIHFGSHSDVLFCLRVYMLMGAKSTNQLRQCLSVVWSKICWVYYFCNRHLNFVIQVLI